jgi:flagellar biosynthesis anti-sigma factor FlgM
MNSVKLNGKINIAPVRGTQHAEVIRENDPYTDQASVSPSSDEVKVSDRAAAIGRLTEQAAQLPDVRTKQVEHLRALVQSGAYRPDAGAVADALLNSEE